MLLAPLPRVSLAARAYETLLTAIVTGSLAPGERIRDADLAEQLQTSRMPVREVLVETVPNRETRVAPVRAERAAQAFPVIAALHALAARLGVPVLTAGDDDRMRSLDRERARALKRGDVIAAIELDDAFHGVLLEAAGNDELIRALERLMPQIRRLDALHFTELTRGDPAADHAGILEACARRDADEAARLVEANFLRLGAQMEAILGDA
jgi:DNA-binding GntR family transcriptional regulator